MNILQARWRAILIALLLAPGWLWAAEPAGFVLMTTGEVLALQPGEPPRALARKSPFYAGESLRTGTDARAQLRFRDGALISMRPDSEIRIDEFEYQADGAGEERNIFTLINGGFRTITGKIGKKDPRNYQMKSSVASIGVRGTSYEVVMADGLNVATWDGTIVVQNEAGAITLGAEGVFNFARVPDRTARPVGMLTPPAGIGDAPEPGVDDAAVQDDDGPSDTSDDSEGGEGVSAETDPQGGTVAADDSSDTTLVSGGSGVTTETTQEPVTMNIFEPITEAVADPRLEGATLTRVGIVQRIDGVSGFDYLVGRSGKDTNGNPLFADVGLAPDDPGFEDASVNSVLRKGSAPLVRDYDHAGLGVSWGIWDGVAQPVELATDASDPAVFTPINQPVHWLAVDATPVATVNGRSGLINYRNVLAFDGIGSDGDVSRVSMNLAVDFDSASVTGDLHLHTANEFWDIVLGGTLIAPGLDITSALGTLNGSQTVTGVAQLLFAGSSAEALTGMVSFESGSDPAVYLDSMFLVGHDLRLSGVAPLDRLVLGSFGGLGTNSFIGRGSPGASPAIGLSGTLDLADPDLWLLSVDEVLRQGSAPDLLAANSSTSYMIGTGDANYAVTWGAWNGESAPLSRQTDPLDPSVAQDVNQNLFWISFLPAPIDSVTLTPGGKTGQILYDQSPAEWFAGVTQAGAIDASSFQFSASLDFDSGLVNSGVMSFSDTASNTWEAFFSGTLEGARLMIGAPTVYYNSDTVNPADANLNAMLTGPQAEGIAGSFDFDYMSGAASAEGVFLVNCAGDANC